MKSNLWLSVILWEFKMFYKILCRNNIYSWNFFSTFKIRLIMFQNISNAYMRLHKQFSKSITLKNRTGKFHFIILWFFFSFSKFVTSTWGYLSYAKFIQYLHRNNFHRKHFPSLIFFSFIHIFRPDNSIFPSLFS